MSDKDTIYRQAAIEAINAVLPINAVFPVDLTMSEYVRGITCGAALAKTYIKQLPPAQPERETGTWIIDDEYPQHCWCSECNNYFSLFDPKSIHFCPNCGSEMKTCVWKSQYEKEN